MKVSIDQQPFKLTKENYHVITGGPGGGKTSLVESIARLGYRRVPETARQIIKERLSKGLSPRPDPKVFARQIFDKDWDNFSFNLNLSEPIFFDRSFMDSACMLFESDPTAYNSIKEQQLTNRYNKKVFVALPWQEIYINDSERDQSFYESISICKKVVDWYAQHNYEIVELPKLSIERRVEFILEQIAKN